MNSKENLKQIAATDVWLKYYEGPNYGGRNQAIAHHGDMIQLSNADGSWLWQARSNGPRTLTYSNLNIDDPAQSYKNRIEEWTGSEIPFFAEEFLFAAHPLSAVTTDETVVARVKISLQNLVNNDSNVITVPDALAATSTIPQSTTQFTSVTAGLLTEGTLGFVDMTQAVTTDVTIRFGFFDNATGTIQWTGSGTLSLVFENGFVSLAGVSGLPADWVISRPVQTPDGAWKIDIRQFAEGMTMFYYPETYFYGTTAAPGVDGLNTQIQFNEGYWNGKSIRVTNMRLGMLYSGVMALAQYRPEVYHQVFFTEPEQPDLPSLYGEGHPTAFAFVAAGNGYFVFIDSEIDDPNYTDFFSQSTMTGMTYFSNRDTGVITASRDGGGDSFSPCTLYYGQTDAEGFYQNTGSGSLFISLNGDTLVVTDVQGFPADWQFSAPVKREDGHWTITLSNAVSAGERNS
ncbi:hypothetical protein BURKHO8Y_10470 [Burkholderia sp. 8Y]|uniref:hypothetical protein n=1 Tax=Burkholderia sp. 8Y TaxID=2653133 RepID=UPI0012F384EB|nr:hypothetical protein [Burkholderia sp. 8Y]VXB11621.1 hypothetical protein BURKHO8Y_10470 [Burkholderia sp. 8Y]